MENVKIVRSSRRRSVGIQVTSASSITVTIPYFFPKFFVNKILKEKEDWIRQKQQALATKAQLKPKNTYFFLGKRYELGTRQQKEMVEVADKLYLGGSTKYTKTYLMSWYKQQARKIIVPRVQHYAALSGDVYRSVSITTAETRWGSCSSNKTLNFNWKLVMAPVEVIDYVVAHELAHLTEMNHSRAFWEKVRKMYPLYREYRTWLKRNGDMLTV